jgi:hypothetical protein
MSELLKTIFGVLTGGAGPAIGGAVAKAAEWIAVLGVLGAAVLWLKENGNDVFHAITYNELAFWGLIVGGLVLIMVRLVHRAPPP